MHVQIYFSIQMYLYTVNETGLISVSSNVHVCTVSMFNIKVLEYKLKKQLITV